MKTLILVRHAKSSWDNSGMSDVNRPLMLRGIMDTNRMARLLGKEKIYEPEVWKTSIANRSIHTAVLFAKELNQLSKLKIHEELYTFDQGVLLRFIKSMSNEAKSAILFLHNPATTHVANLLGDKEFKKIPTSGVVVLKLNVDSWSDLPSRGSTVEAFYFPNKSLSVK